MDSSNGNLSVNDYLDANKSANTKKLDNQAIQLFNSTILSLGKKVSDESSHSDMEYKTLDQYSLDSLPEALARFFMVVRRQNGEIHNASSLNSFYRAIVRHLKTRDVNPVDITTDIRFSKVSQVLKTKCCEAAKDGKRPGLNSAQCLSDDDLETVFKSGALSRDNPRGLISLVHYVVMTTMGARAQEECRQITCGDMVMGPKSKECSDYPQYITLSERITKTRHGGKSDIREIEGRCYLDPESPETCPVRTILAYQARKTHLQLQSDQPFFLTVKPTAEKDPQTEIFWYKNCPMGVNLLGKLFKNACDKAGLDTKAKKISATSCRKNLVQVGVEQNVPSPFLSKMLGQKSLDSKLHYLKHKDSTHKAASIVTSRSTQGKTDAKQDFNKLFRDIRNGKEETSVNPSPDQPQPVESVHSHWSPHSAQPPQPSPYPPPPPSPYYPPPQPYPYYPPPPSSPYYPPPPSSPYYPPQPYPYYQPSPYYPPPPPPVDYYPPQYYPQQHQSSYQSDPHYNQNYYYQQPPQQFQESDTTSALQFNPQESAGSNKRPLEDISNVVETRTYNFSFKKTKTTNEEIENKSLFTIL